MAKCTAAGACACAPHAQRLASCSEALSLMLARLASCVPLNPFAAPGQRGGLGRGAVRHGGPAPGPPGPRRSPHPADRQGGAACRRPRDLLHFSIGPAGPLPAPRRKDAAAPRQRSRDPLTAETGSLHRDLFWRRFA